jgi:hypothetical protein
VEIVSCREISRRRAPHSGNGWSNTMCPKTKADCPEASESRHHQNLRKAARFPPAREENCYLQLSPWWQLTARYQHTLSIYARLAGQDVAWLPACFEDLYRRLRGRGKWVRLGAQTSEIESALLYTLSVSAIEVLQIL